MKELPCTSTATTAGCTNWSPLQITARLPRIQPDDPRQHVRHDTSYAAIHSYPRGSLKKDMVEALRETKSLRERRRTALAKGRTIA